VPTFIRLGLKKMGIRVVQKKVERIVGGVVRGVWMPDWNEWMSDWSGWYGGGDSRDVTNGLGVGDGSVLTS